MKIIKQNFNYLDNIDILIRVYENQIENAPENEQCVGEILFKYELGIEHKRFTSWLPKGLARAIVESLESLNLSKDTRIQISNEFGLTLGVLTSVKDNFDIALNNDLGLYRLNSCL